MQLQRDRIIMEFSKFLNEHAALLGFLEGLSVAAFKQPATTIAEHIDNELSYVKDEYRFCPSQLIFNAFDWSQTAEDDEFWSELHEIWQAHAEDVDFTVPGAFKSIW